MKTIPVEIQTFAGCLGGEKAVAFVQSAAATAGVQVEIQVVMVETQADAERLKFPGSPTILVNGVDVEPAQRVETYQLACRVYRGDAGFSDLPREHTVVDALLKMR